MTEKSTFISEAKELNYSVSNEYELIDFIKKIDVQLLLKKTFQSLYFPANGTKAFSHGWTFAIEGRNSVYRLTFLKLSFDLLLHVDKNAIDPFLTESVFSILTNSSYESHVDVLFSYSPRVCFNVEIMHSTLHSLEFNWHRVIASFVSFRNLY